MTQIWSNQNKIQTIPPALTASPDVRALSLNQRNVYDFSFRVAGQNRSFLIRETITSNQLKLYLVYFFREGKTREYCAEKSLLEQIRDSTNSTKTLDGTEAQIEARTVWWKASTHSAPTLVSIRRLFVTNYLKVFFKDEWSCTGTEIKRNIANNNALITAQLMWSCLN